MVATLRDDGFFGFHLHVFNASGMEIYSKKRDVGKSGRCECQLRVNEDQERLYVAYGKKTRLVQTVQRRAKRRAFPHLLHCTVVAIVVEGHNRGASQNAIMICDCCRIYAPGITKRL